MGLKSFLQQQGFIANDPSEKQTTDNNIGKQPVTPTFFPTHGSAGIPPESIIVSANGPEPSFVTPLAQQSISQTSKVEEQIDPSFIKFFEDELVKANLPGPDYFEFRQLLIKTQQKMNEKGGAAPEIVLQAVLMSFEAQDVPTPKLIEAAKHYKEAIKNKNDDFIKGAEAEKNNQLQKRQGVLQAHADKIKNIEMQLEKLALQKQQLDDSIAKEKTQLEIDKMLGQEGIDKIERAKRAITLAHNFMQATIDKDIQRLQAV
jgi:hypothetical protein